MKLQSKVAALLIAAVLMIVITGPLQAQTVGIRAGRYMDTDEYFIGGELLSRISRNLYFNPNVEYIFVPNTTLMTFNLDFHYDFYTTSPLFFWMGAGLGILYNKPPGVTRADTDLGINLLFGLGVRTASTLTPYIQGKLFLADRNEFSLGVGIRF